MNMSYVDHARMTACQVFMGDHDHDEDYLSNLDHAFDIAREVYHVETPDYLAAGFVIDEAMFHVRLEMFQGAITRQSVDATYP